VPVSLLNPSKVLPSIIENNCGSYGRNTFFAGDGCRSKQTTIRTKANIAAAAHAR
jgi:hypothetical protein